MRKKRYIEDLEGRVNALEDENSKLKEKLEMLEQKLLVKEQAGMKERYERFAKKGLGNAKELLESEVAKQKNKELKSLSVSKIKQKYDIFNTER